jgi:transglutaminase-like putative cysteine protease
MLLCGAPGLLGRALPAPTGQNRRPWVLRKPRIRCRKPFPLRYLHNDANLTGAEASHAWVSVWCPVLGWQGFDPTNNTMPGGRHVTVAWGRDCSDVTPVRGVALGGGEHVISVSVDVSQISDV